MSNDQQETTSIDAIESEIASMGASAFGKARRRALASKQTVVFASGGHLIRINPSGEREEIGVLEKPAREFPFHYEKDVEIAI